MQSTEIIANDLHDLRTEMREGFHQIHDKLDRTLARCVDDCPQVFASRDAVKNMQGWVRLTCIAILILGAAIMALHGQAAIGVLERLIKLI